MSFDRDFDWQRRFIFRLKSICGAYLIKEATWEEDALHNTDLIVLAVPAGLRVACRVRRNRYLQQPAYRDQFTLRNSRPSGVATELDKVLLGWGDYILYAFADAEEKGLASWVLGDLDVFRRWHQSITDWGGIEPGTVRGNHDGSSDFVAFDIDALPREFVVARRTVHGLSVRQLDLWTGVPA